MRLTLEAIRKQLTQGQWVGLEGDVLLRGGERQPLTEADKRGILSLVRLLPQLIEAFAEHELKSERPKGSPTFE